LLGKVVKSIGDRRRAKRWDNTCSSNPRPAIHASLSRFLRFLISNQPTHEALNLRSKSDVS
jgi:hypothetical protein